MSEQESIILKMNALIIYVIPILDGYPRSKKYFLGDRIQNYLLDILEALIEAYYSKKDEKIKILMKVNIILEKIRYLFRLSFDLKCINTEKYGKLSEKLIEIGKMNGGWLKSLQ